MKKKSEIIIIVLSMLIVGLILYIIVDKSISKNITLSNNSQNADQSVTTNNMSSINLVKNEMQSEETKIKKDENDPVTTKDDGSEENEENSNTKSVDNKNENNSEQKEVVAIKKALKDNNWLAENVMMKESCFVDVPIMGKQKLTFMRVVESDYKPMIIIEAYSEDDISVQDFMVYYKDGKVISKPLTSGALHTGHAGIGVDPNNAKMLYNYMHMGYG